MVCRRIGTAIEVPLGWLWVIPRICVSVWPTLTEDQKITLKPYSSNLDFTFPFLRYLTWKLVRHLTVVFEGHSEQDPARSRLQQTGRTAAQNSTTSLHTRRPHKYAGGNIYTGEIQRWDSQCVRFLTEFKIELTVPQWLSPCRAPVLTFNIKRQPYLQNIFPFSYQSFHIPLTATHKPCKPMRTARIRDAFHERKYTNGKV